MPARVLLIGLLLLAGLTPFGAPAVSAAGAPAPVAFLRGSDNALWYRPFTGSGWGQWHSLGGVLTAEPRAAFDASGRIDVFIRGVGDDVWQRSFDGATWGSWTSLGGVIASAPIPVAAGAGQFNLFGRGTDGPAWH